MKTITKRMSQYKSTLMGVILLAVVASALYASQLMAATEEKQATAPARPAMPVETAEVKIADSAQEFLAVGTLKSNESVIVMSEIPGRIAKIAFKEGESVDKGQLLVKLDSSVLQAEFDRVEAARALSEKNYQRSEALFKDNAISEIERDEAHSKWLLDAASTRLAKAQLDKATITAPFSGVLGLRNMSVGDYIQPGTPLVNLEEVKQLKVDFSVPEKYSVLVKAGQKITLTTDSFGDRTFTGEVYAINPRIDENSRSLMVRGKIDNRDGLLLPGQFAKVKLVVSTKSAAVFIPEQALISQPTAQIVYKVIDGKAQIAPVQTGQRLKGWVEIVSGLGQGDIVVTGGHQKIGPGSPVHAIAADPELFGLMDETAITKDDNKS